jgi:hypothetical protein
MTDVEERLRVDLHASANVRVSDHDVEQAWRRMRAGIAEPAVWRPRVVPLAAAAAVLAVVLGLAWWQLARGSEATLPVSPPVGSTSVPFCITDPDDPDGEVIVGAGAPVKALCRYTPGHDPARGWDRRRANWLWHHAGSTILQTGDGGNYRVVDGRLTRLGDDPGGAPVMSQDGRYVAWSVPDCVTRFPKGPDFGPWLYIFEVATAQQVARTTVPTPGSTIGPCSPAQVLGIDDLGRVYVEVEDESPGGVHVVQLYDRQTGEWTRVVGIPAGTGDITYATVDGIAVSTREQVDDGGSSSVEGRVDNQGRFVRQREVPVGQGLWSPDRSFVVDHEPDGVVVRPASDLHNRVVLDLPVDQSPHPPTVVVMWQTQWESANTVLVRVPVGDDDQRFYRCEVRSGACTVTSRSGVMALSNNIRWSQVPG